MIERRARRARATTHLGPIVLAFAVVGCGRKEPMAPVGVSDKPGTSTMPSDRPIDYTFDSLDDRPVSAAASLGKPTVLAFVTTGDLLGQAQVDYLVAMAKNDQERVNYALVALHPRKEIVLVEAYAKTLGVDFPVALGNLGERSPMGTQAFGDIPAVPTVIILGRDGKIVWKHTGLAKSEELRAHMRGL